MSRPVMDTASSDDCPRRPRRPARKAGGAERSRRDILDTAARLFRKDGYAGVSLRRIAAACGMKAGSLYYHFSAKDEIVAEILRLGVDHVYVAVREAVAALPDATPPATVIGTAVETHLRGLLELQDYTSANIRIFGQLPKAVRRRHLALRDEYEAFWATLIGQYVARESADAGRDLGLARFFLIGAMNSTLEWYRPAGGGIGHVAAELTALLLHGLHGPCRPSARTRRRR